MVASWGCGGEINLVSVPLGDLELCHLAKSLTDLLEKSWARLESYLRSFNLPVGPHKLDGVDALEHWQRVRRRRRAEA